LQPPFLKQLGSPTRENISGAADPFVHEINAIEMEMEQALMGFWYSEQQRLYAELEPQIPPDRKVAVQLAFWSAEARHLLAILLPFLQRAAEKGVLAQAAAAGIDLDWTAAMTEASKWAREHCAKLVKGITDTTRDRIRNIIANWMETEHTFPQLWRQIMNDMAFSRYRARLIAATETTKAYAEGKMIGTEPMEAAGYFEYDKKWQTANDDIVCPICLPMNQKTVRGVRTEFDISKIGPLQGPPAHPGCRCGLSMIPRVPK